MQASRLSDQRHWEAGVYVGQAGQVISGCRCASVCCRQSRGGVAVTHRSEGCKQKKGQKGTRWLPGRMSTEEGTKRDRRGIGGSQAEGK